MTRHHSNVGSSSAANPSAAEEGPVPVLVVDDDPHHLQIETIVLTRAGYDVRTARNAAEARAAIEARRPAVIVLDVGLPEEDGLSLGRSIRLDRHNDDIAIVIYTAYGDVVDRKRIGSAGCDGFMTKPARSEQYLGVVRECLERRRRAATP